MTEGPSLDLEDPYGVSFHEFITIIGKTKAIYKFHLN